MTANICPKCGNAVTPIRWRTFIQNDEPTLEPMARLKRSLGEQHHRLALESVDQTWTLEVLRSCKVSFSSPSRSAN